MGKQSCEGEDVHSGQPVAEQAGGGGTERAAQSREHLQAQIGQFRFSVNAMPC